jgi:hypothetical protein
MSTIPSIKSAMAEIDAAILVMGRYPDTDATASAALLRATTARAFLRDALEAAELKCTVSRYGEGDRTINTLKQAAKAVEAWAAQNDQPGLERAMLDIHGLAVACWSVVDESLSWLFDCARSIERGKPDDALKAVRVGMGILNTWQDRDGAIGNAELTTADELTAVGLPTSINSAEVNDVTQGLRIVKSRFGHEAKLIVKSGMVDAEELRRAWPELVAMLV